MADSSQQKISYQKEPSPGTIDDTAPFKALRFTGGSFPHTTDTSRSEQVRPDGQRSGTVRTNVSSAPSLNIELSPRSFDDLISGVMRDDWSPLFDESASDISTTDNSDGTGTIDSASTVTFTPLEAKQWVNLSGSSADGANGWYKVLSVSASSLTVAPAPAVISAGNEITIKGSYLRNGIGNQSFALMRQFGDISGKYEVIKACRVNQLDLSIDAGSIVTGSISFEGLRKELMETMPGNGTVEDAPGTEIANAVDHVRAVMSDEEGNMAPISADVMSASIGLNQNARRQDAVGTLGAAGIAYGSLDATGSISLYLTSGSWKYLVRYVNFEKFGLALAFETSDGAYLIDFPKIALTSEPGNVPGTDDDIMLELDFSAEPGESYDKTVQMVRTTVNS